MKEIKISQNLSLVRRLTSRGKEERQVRGREL